MFNPESLFWRIISKGVDFIGLSLFWAALCLPVVTIGPATAALYYTVVKTFRYKEDGAFGMMWKTFKANLRQGIPVTLICLPFLLALFYGYSVMKANISTEFGYVMYVAYYVAMIIPLGVLCTLFPLMSRFELSKKDLFRTSFSLTLYHLPSTIILVLLTLELAVWTIEKWSPVFITPVGWALISSWFLEKNFAKHLTADEAAALERRADDNTPRGGNE